MPHNRAQLFFRYKHSYLDHGIIEARIWNVPVSQRTPEGLKYSLVYVDSSGRRVLGYDNAEGKGHHRHIGDAEESVDFRGMWDLVFGFLGEVKALREGKR